MGNPIIRHGTEEDIEKFYGEKLPHSVRVIVVELNGQIVGVAGLARHIGTMTAFSEMRDELRDYPVTIFKTGVQLAQLAQRYKGSVWAQASETEPNSIAFLERLGFEHCGDGFCKI